MYNLLFEIIFSLSSSVLSFLMAKYLTEKNMNKKKSTLVKFRDGRKMVIEISADSDMADLKRAIEQALSNEKSPPPSPNNERLRKKETKEYKKAA